MALQVVVTPGDPVVAGSLITEALLRRLAKPSVTINGAVDAGDIPDGSLTNAKFANNNLDLSAKALDLSLTTEKIANGAVTTAKVAPGPYFYAEGIYDTGVYGITVTPAPTAYAAGQIFRFKADTVNAGAVDLNFNSLGAKSLFKKVSQELTAGDILEDQLVEVQYDGTNFQLLSVMGQPDPGVLVGAARNLIVQYNTASSVRATADELILKNASGVSLLRQTVDATATITTAGAGGIDAGGEANSTWYYLWIISDGTLNAALLSLSATAPTLPGDYTYKALVGCVFNNSSGDFITFYQRDREVWLNETNIFDAKAAGAGSTYQELTGDDLTAFRTLVPPIAKRARGLFGGVNGLQTDMGVAADGSGLGATRISGASLTWGDWGMAASFDVLQKTNTLFWQSVDTSARNRLSITGYTL